MAYVATPNMAFLDDTTFTTPYHLDSWTHSHISIPFLAILQQVKTMNRDSHSLERCHTSRILSCLCQFFWTQSSRQMAPSPDFMEHFFPNTLQSFLPANLPTCFRTWKHCALPTPSLSNGCAGQWKQPKSRLLSMSYRKRGEEMWILSLIFLRRIVNLITTYQRIF